MTQHTVLFELGCEELPPKSLKTLRDALQAETVKGLQEAGLNFASIEAYAAPRRLALKIVDVDGAQADTQKRFDGPAVQAAYDAEGKPTALTVDEFKKELSESPDFKAILKVSKANGGAGAPNFQQQNNQNQGGQEINLAKASPADLVAAIKAKESI